MGTYFFAADSPPGSDIRLSLKYVDWSTDVPLPSDDVIGSFCFPEGKTEHYTAMGREPYTFALTHGGGSRLHGYCWRFVPRSAAGSQSKPVVLCIVAHQPWLSLFFRVLEVIEQILLKEDLLASKADALPSSSDAATFLTSVCVGLSDQPAPDSVLRLVLPRASYTLTTSHRIRTNRAIPHGDSSSSNSGRDHDAEALMWSDDFLDVQVPPLCVKGADPSIATVPLALLLFSLSPSIVAALYAALLLERRIVFVSSSRQTLSYAVHAAVALIHPFRWHHIFIPILPHSLLDYLSAPQPFIIGLPAALQKHMNAQVMEEVVVIDLDLRAISYTGSSDNVPLPWKDRLVDALASMRQTLGSPMQHTTNELISGIMQEYLVTLIGRYPRYVRHKDQLPPPMPAHRHAAVKLRHMKEQLREAATKRDLSQASTVVAPALDLRAGVVDCGGGWLFYHEQFAASFRDATCCAFASALRHSQLWEVFICERVAGQSHSSLELDAFDARIANRKVAQLPLAWKSTLSSLTQAQRPGGRAIKQWLTSRSTTISEAALRVRSAFKDLREGTDWMQTPGGMAQQDQQQPLSDIHRPETFFMCEEDDASACSVETDFGTSRAQHSSPTDHVPQHRLDATSPGLSTHSTNDICSPAEGAAPLEEPSSVSLSLERSSTQCSNGIASTSHAARHVGALHSSIHQSNQFTPACGDLISLEDDIESTSAIDRHQSSPDRTNSEQWSMDDPFSILAGAQTVPCTNALPSSQCKENFHLGIPASDHDSDMSLAAHSREEPLAEFDLLAL